MRYGSVAYRHEHTYMHELACVNVFLPGLKTSSDCLEYHAYMKSQGLVGRVIKKVCILHSLTYKDLLDFSNISTIPRIYF